MKLVRVQKNVVTAKQNGAAKRVKVSPAALAALADLHIDVDTKKWAKLILQINGFHGDDVSAQSLIDRTWDILNIRKQRLVHGIKRRIGESGYPARKPSYPVATPRQESCMGATQLYRP